MRRYFFIIVLLAATILPTVVAYAQAPAGSTGVTTDFKALAPIPGLTGDATGKSTSVLSSNSLAEFFNNLYIYAIGMAAAIAVIQIIYAGLQIAFFNKDNVSKLMDSKGRIAQSIYGLILIFSPVVVFSIINPSILNLQLNLQPLDTANNGSSSSGTGSGIPTDTDSETGCEVTGAAGILQIATCPSESTAKAWGAANCTAGFSLSEVIPLTIVAGGTPGQSRIICQTSKTFGFIETKTAYFDVWINEIDPLAVTKNNPNNAAEAILFANTCASLGRTTCLPRVGYIDDGETTCDPIPTTQIPVGSGSGKCYNRNLSCQSGKVVGSGYLCEKEPAWTSFK